MTKFILLLIIFSLNPLIAMEEASDKYAINLMWIHATHSEEPYLYRSCNQQDKETYFKEEVVKPLHGWAKTNPSAPVIFWYDSEYTTKEAIELSQSFICQEDLLNVSARDIRDLDFVNEADSVIFSDTTPVYFRSDLLRPIIQRHQLLNENFRYSIYSDLDVSPISYEELFDEKTKADLRKFGLVMASGKGTNSLVGYENAFMILSQDRPAMVKALDELVIRSSVLRAQKYAGVTGIRIKSKLPEVVFYFYRDLLDYSNYLEGKADFYLPAKEGDKIKYDPSLHYKMERFPCFSLPGERPDEMITIVPSTKENLPVKDIKMKPQGGFYY